VASCHGHPRSTNCSAIALAERLSERLIGSIRREMLDHVIVFGEGHLRQLLRSYMTYYNEARTHLSLNKDALVPRKVQSMGQIFAVPHLGGLHHQYVRI